MMDKDHFIGHYIASFLAAWAAVEYNDACMQGRHATLEDPPSEDALHLAKCAWKRMEATGVVVDGRIRSRS